MKTIDELLHQREAQNLKYMSGTRIFLSFLGILTNLVANSAFFGDLYLHSTILVFIWIVSITLNSVFLWCLQHNTTHLKTIGYTGVLVDTIALCLLPEIWYHMAGTTDMPLSFFLKYPITTYCFIIVAISCLAMKPQYPAIVTGGVFLNHVYYFWIGITDPATHISQNLFEVYFGSAVSIDVFISNTIMFVITSATLIFFTYRARKVVYEAANLEYDAAVIREQQTRMLMQGKMDSLHSLVSGFTHEMNSPIGAIQSGQDTTTRCAQKVTEVIDNATHIDDVKTSAPLQKTLKVLTLTSATTKNAADRISTIVNSLKSFARLDEAEFQMVDLHEGLDSTLTLMSHILQDRITITKNYGLLPKIGCKPTEINQVFHNLLTNAAQAISDTGTIIIQTEMKNDQVCITISDTGIGMTPEQSKHLFEPRFSRKGSRVKAGLGLFASYHIIQNHHGDLHVESQPNQGTTVTVYLPIHQAD